MIKNAASAQTGLAAFSMRQAALPHAQQGLSVANAARHMQRAPRIPI